MHFRFQTKAASPPSRRHLFQPNVLGAPALKEKPQKVIAPTFLPDAAKWTQILIPKQINAAATLTGKWI